MSDITSHSTTEVTIEDNFFETFEFPIDSTIDEIELTKKPKQDIIESQNGIKFNVNPIISQDTLLTSQLTDIVESLHVNEDNFEPQVITDADMLNDYLAQQDDSPSDTIDDDDGDVWQVHDEANLDHIVFQNEKNKIKVKEASVVICMKHTEVNTKEIPSSSSSSITTTTITTNQPSSQNKNPPLLSMPVEVQKILSNNTYLSQVDLNTMINSLDDDELLPIKNNTISTTTNNNINNVDDNDDDQDPFADIAASTPQSLLEDQSIMRKKQKDFIILQKQILQKRQVLDPILQKQQQDDYLGKLELRQSYISKFDNFGDSNIAAMKKSNKVDKSNTIDNISDQQAEESLISTIEMDLDDFFVDSNETKTEKDLDTKETLENCNNDDEQQHTDDNDVLHNPYDETLDAIQSKNNDSSLPE